MAAGGWAGFTSRRPMVFSVIMPLMLVTACFATFARAVKTTGGRTTKQRNGEHAMKHQNGYETSTLRLHRMIRHKNIQNNAHDYFWS